MFHDCSVAIAAVHQARLTVVASGIGGLGEAAGTEVPSLGRLSLPLPWPPLASLPLAAASRFPCLGNLSLPLPWPPLASRFPLSPHSVGVSARVPAWVFLLEGACLFGDLEIMCLLPYCHTYLEFMCLRPHLERSPLNHHDLERSPLNHHDRHLMFMCRLQPSTRRFTTWSPATLRCRRRRRLCRRALRHGTST